MTKITSRSRNGKRTRTVTCVSLVTTTSRVTEASGSSPPCSRAVNTSTSSLAACVFARESPFAHLIPLLETPGISSPPLVLHGLALPASCLGLTSPGTCPSLPSHPGTSLPVRPRPNPCMSSCSPRRFTLFLCKVCVTRVCPSFLPESK